MPFVSRIARALPFALVVTVCASTAQTTPAVAVAAATPAPARENAAEAELLKRLREAFPASRIDSVATTPVDGVFEVVAGPNVFYTDNSGRYVLFGKLFDMKTRTDITAARIAEVQRLDVSILTHANAIKEVRGNGKRVLYVFADPNCGYCKALEKTLQEVNDVTVYTYLVPLLGPTRSRKGVRSGVPPTAPRPGRTGCSRQNPKPASDRCDDPLDINTELSKKLDIPGTPMLIAADGRRLMGAVAAAEIEALLSKPPPLLRLYDHQDGSLDRGVSNEAPPLSLRHRLSHCRPCRMLRHDGPRWQQ